MPISHRRLALTVAATLALGAGAGAAPALASTDSLSQAIRQQIPKIQEDVGPIGTRAKDDHTIAGLQADTKACEAAVAVVAPIPASPDGQQQAKRDWLTGVRMQIVANDQLVAGLRDVLSGHAAVGKVLVADSGASEDRADDDTSTGQRLLGLG